MSDVTESGSEREFGRSWAEQVSTGVSRPAVGLDRPVTGTESVPEGFELFSVLKNTRRRHVLQYILTERRRVSLAEMAVYIAAIENDISPSEVTSSQRKRVYVALYQSHLPKLHEVGAVEYNDARKYASPGEKLEAFRPYLGETEEGPYWSLGYFGLGLATTGSLGVFQFTGLSSRPVALGLLVTFVAAFVVLTAYHTYRTTEDR